MQTKMQKNMLTHAENTCKSWCRNSDMEKKCTIWAKGIQMYFLVSSKVVFPDGPSYFLLENALGDFQLFP